MKIVHLLPYYAPAWGFGGVVRAAHGLTVALAARGHEVVVVTTDAGADGGRLPSGEHWIDGVRVWRCPNVWPGLRRLNLSTPRGLRRVLAEALAGADVLHLHELRTVENVLALPVTSRLHVPVVLSPHGTLPRSTGRSLVKRGWDAILGRWLARRIDGVVALTEAERAVARALWAGFDLTLPDERVWVVPNGVNLAEFADLPPRDTFRVQWGVPPDAPLLLFLGRLHVRKGVHHLLDALPLLPQTWLAVVGPDEGQLAALRAQAERSGVMDRVRFTGLLTGQDRLTAFAGADLLALPATGEGLPMVVLEALAAGLPVALSDGCHFPQAVEAGAGVRLHPLTGQAIAQALAPVLVDPERRQEMAEAGRALVRTQYSWDAVAAQVEACYAQCKAISATPVA